MRLDEMSGRIEEVEHESGRISRETFLLLHQHTFCLPVSNSTVKFAMSHQPTTNLLCWDYGLSERDNYNLYRHRLWRYLRWQFSPYVCNDCQIGLVDYSALVLHAQSIDHVQAGSEIFMGLCVRVNVVQFRLDNAKKYFNEGN